MSKFAWQEKGFIMKKVILALIAALLIFGLVGCAGNDGAEPAADDNAMDETVSFTGVISEVNGTSAIVVPNEGEPIRSSGDKVSITIEDGAFAVGDTVIIEHYPEVMESYPLQIRMISIEKVD